MKLAVFVTVVCVAVSSISAAQGARSRAPQAPATSPARVAQAYEQFLIGHHLEESDDVSGAIAAYRKAIELDPSAADIPAELAGLYLRHDKVDEAVGAAEQALKVGPANPEAHRVLGLIAAAKIDGRPRQQQGGADADVTSAIQHLEKAIANPLGEADPNARGTLARLYLRVASFDKAIPLLVDLVRQQPAWLDGPRLLAQAYAGRAEPPTRSICSTSRRRKIQACCRRSRTSTSGRSGGRTRRMRTRGRSASRRETSS